MSDTIFGKIVSGEIPTEFVYEDEHCVAINDIRPAAPVHVLVIPRKAIAKLADAQPEDQALLGHLMLAVGNITRQLGVSEAFRLIVNNGSGGGQTVFHLHLHILAGADLSEARMLG
ncbi:MAG: histidine triad nucleotide-binding protein [Parahaliea sp.]